MNLPGFHRPGDSPPFYFRIVLWGLQKSGKTMLAMTFPSPYFIHPVQESGYDSFKLEKGHLFPFAAVGGTHHQAVLSMGGDFVESEVFVHLNYLASLHATQNCPYKTLVLGGLSVLQGLVISHAETAIPRTRGNKEDPQRQWGFVSQFFSRLVHTALSLPMHVIFEVSAKVLEKDREGKILQYVPDISGKGYYSLMNPANLILYQECLGSSLFQTHFTTKSGVPKAYAESRLQALKVKNPIQNCSYDQLAYSLGLPLILEADPNHPRCKPGVWPWSSHWHA